MGPAVLPPLQPVGSQQPHRVAPSVIPSPACSRALQCALSVLRLDRSALRGDRRTRLGLRRPQFCFFSSSCSLRGSMPVQHGTALRIPPHPRWVCLFVGGTHVCLPPLPLCLYVLLPCIVWLYGRSRWSLVWPAHVTGLAGPTLGCAVL